MVHVRTVIAVTGEDDRFEAVRRAAIARAREERATLILYDLDAVESPLESPVPTAWSAEGTAEEVSDRLGPAELEAAGREAIADQVRKARDQGLDAWGWLPSDAGRAALIEYAANQPGARVLVPDGEPDLSIQDLPEAEVVPTGRPTD
ncbi:MAG: hypothetical protein ACREBE_01980 [bacterium]